MISTINESPKESLYHKVKCLWLALRGRREERWQLERDDQSPFLLPGSFSRPTNYLLSSYCVQGPVLKPAQSLVPIDRKTNLVHSALNSPRRLQGQTQPQPDLVGRG